MPPKLTVEIDGDTRGLSTALGSANRGIKGFGGALGGMVPLGAIGIGVTAVAALTKVTIDLTKAGMDAVAEEEAFARALGNIGISADEHATKLEKAITASQQLAFTDTETRNSLVSLATATKDVNGALDLLAVAQDVARLANVDLETAADAVAKAHAGQDMSLRRLIPGMAKGATAADTIAEATRLAQGASEDFAKSSDGVAQIAENNFSEIQEAVGKELLPVMLKLWDSLQPVIASLLRIAMKILPPFAAAVSKVFDIMSKWLGMIEDIIGAVEGMIDTVGDALQPLRDLANTIGSIDLNPLNHLPSFSLPDLWSAPSGPTVTPMAAGGAGAGSVGNVQINIYGDPAVIEAKVTKALRDYARRNGQAAVFSTNRTR